jgi:hypothetical protein
VGHTYERGLHGFKVFKFKLVPIIISPSAAARTLRFVYNARRCVGSKATLQKRLGTPRSPQQLSNVSRSEEKKRNDPPTLSYKDDNFVKLKAPTTKRPGSPKTATLTPRLANAPRAEEESQNSKVSDAPISIKNKQKEILERIYAKKLQQMEFAKKLQVMELDMPVNTKVVARKEPKSCSKHSEVVSPKVAVVVKADPGVDELTTFHIPKRKRNAEPVPPARTKAEEKQPSVLTSQTRKMVAGGAGREESSCKDDFAAVHVPKKSSARPDQVHSHGVPTNQARMSSLIENIPPPSNFQQHGMWNNNKRRRYR